MPNIRRMQMAAAGAAAAGGGTAAAGLYMWGAGDYGTLAQGDDKDDKTEPTQVGDLTDWTSEIGQGSNIVMAVKSDGTLWSWGLNGTDIYLPDGQLGLGDTNDRSSPTQVGSLTNWAKVSRFGSSNHAIKTDGTLWGWGTNSYGGIGDGTSVGKSSPVQIGSATNWALIADRSSEPTLAIRSDGTMWAWGRNDYGGSLGLGDTTNRSAPTQIGSLTTWATASAYLHSGAIKTDGTLWVWGKNQYGQLGLGSTTDYSSPVQVGSLTNWATIKMGGGGGYMMATKTDGTLWGWGRNHKGYVGVGDTTSYSSPVQIGSLTNWATVGCGNMTTYARKTDGTIWAWGVNSDGNIGDGTTDVKSSPVQIGESTAWTHLSAGGYHGAGIKDAD